MFSHFRRTWARLRSALNISVRQPQSRLPLWWSALLLVRRQMSRAWRVHKRGVIIGETNYVGFKNVKCFMASPVTTEKRNDWILPPWSLTFDFEPLIGVWHFRQRGATFSINRLGNKLGNKSRRYFMSEIWQNLKNNDTLLHNARPHRWSEEPAERHSQAHTSTSIEELRIDFELKVKKSRSLSKVHKLTWVRLCIFVQEGGAVDWNLLGLAAPIAMGQAAGEWASLPWIE